MTTFNLTAEQVQSAIAGHDLMTYKGWVAAARALLAGAPDWTAIKDGDHGYTVVVDGDVFALAAEDAGDEAVYDAELLVDFDESAWNEALGCWEGGDQGAASTLDQPVFVALKHK